MLAAVNGRCHASAPAAAVIPRVATVAVCGATCAEELKTQMRPLCVGNSIRLIPIHTPIRLILRHHLAH
eukprot:gene9570-biopygen2837